MVRDALVVRQIEITEEMIRLMDAAGVRVSVAVLVFDEAYSDRDWKLVLAAKELDGLPYLVAVRKVIDILRAANYRSESMELHFEIEPTNSPLIEELLSTYGKWRYIPYMRIGGRRFGGRYLEDAVAVRIVSELDVDTKRIPQPA